MQNTAASIIFTNSAGASTIAQMNSVDNNNVSIGRGESNERN